MDGQTYTKLEEGERLEAYDDATGEVLPAGATPSGTCTISVGCTGPDIVPGLVITPDQSTAMYASRYAQFSQKTAMVVGAAWAALDIVRQAALISVAYNVGWVGLSKFHDTLACVASGDWHGAHDNILASAAARELPARYGRVALMLLTGEWQPGYGA